MVKVLKNLECKNLKKKYCNYISMGNVVANLFDDKNSDEDTLSTLSKSKEESEDIRINERISKLDSNLSPSKKKKEIEKIQKEEKKKTLEIKKKSKKKKKEIFKFNPVSLFIDRTPEELDDRVRAIVKSKLKGNPKMTDEELTKLISETTILVVEELSNECEEEYALVKTILSPEYGNGKWPNKKELEKLINEKNFPWKKSQIIQWPEEKDIVSCKIISAIKDKITMNNRCVYSLGYKNVLQSCNVECGKGTEIKAKSLVKNINEDFPSIQGCGDIPQKEFICDSGKICKEDCKTEVDLKSFGEARCSKPCDSGDGPGEKTYKIKYLKSSKGGGSCDLEEKGKKEGESYDVTVPCNEDKCPPCDYKTKGPYKDGSVDYTRSINIQGNNKTYTACLLPKEDGTYEDIDCGGGEGGFNYNKGARSKYNVTYNVTQDNYGVQNCTKGKDVIEEECAINIFTPDLTPIVKDGKIAKGGGDPCGNECVLSEDYPQLVMVDGKQCSKECGTGKRRMRKVVKSKSDAPYCPCKNDPSKCPYEEIDCNTQECIAPCVYANQGKHVQINDYCPGVQGPNKHIVWDTTKVNPDGGKGMWYDSIKNKHYPRSHFIKKMRVPTKTPPIGKGLCYQGDKADQTLQCNLDGTERPIDAEWGPWTFAGYIGEPNILQSVSPKYRKWDDPSNANLQSKIDKRVQDRLDANEKDPITGELLTEDTIRKEETHCVDKNYLDQADDFDLPLPGKKYVRSVSVFPQYGGKDVVGPFEKIEPYMKKGTDYTRYCPVDKLLTPEVWIGDGQTVGAEWDNTKCYKTDGKGGLKQKYRVSELEEEAKKKFVRDSDLPNYEAPREGENRIIGVGSRTIFKYKERDGSTTPEEKYGGLPDGKWHSTTGDQNYKYDRRNVEYDECEGVRDILKKIKNNNNDWKAEDRYVHQKDCNPVYDWDGKYYMSNDAALAGETGEEIKTNTDTGRVELSTEEKKMYPGSTMRKTTNGKFMTNDMHTSSKCKRPGLDSAYAWCGKESTDDYIQMITYSGGIERVKGVVTQARKDSNQWVKTFEVYVSRNGDSWQQVKDASGNFTFSASFSKKGDKKVKNYFQNRVEAKYIRFVTKTWEGHNSMRIGYIKDLSNTVDCYGGSGILSGEPWFRLTFNKQKTIDSGGYSEGTHSSTKICPPDGDVLTYQRGGDIATDFTNLKLNVNNIKEVTSGMPDKSVSASECQDYADKNNYGWTPGYTNNVNPSGCFIQGSNVYFGVYADGSECGNKHNSKCLEKTENSGIKENLKEIMNESSSGFPSCGTDAVRTGWRSSSSEGSFGWSDCVKPDSSGLETSTKAWNTNDGGFRYMYNKWKNLANGSDYKEWSNDSDHKKDSAHPSAPTKTSSTGTRIYEDISKSYTNKDGHKYNIIRQPCHRGATGSLPTLGTGWVSDLCSCEGQSSTGYTGAIYNITGGTEGWIDSSSEYTWANFFKNTIKSLVNGKYSSGSFQSAVNDYKVEEKEGVTNSDNTAAWSSTYRSKANTKIGASGSAMAWHSSSKSSWNTSLTDKKSVAMYEQTGKFIPIGIKIQPRNRSDLIPQMPSEIRLAWNGGEKTVTLGTFATKDTIKTILINPTLRNETTYLYVWSRHGRNSSGSSFRINFLIGVTGGKSIDKGTINCKNNENRPVDCKEGSSAGLEGWLSWTNRSGTFNWTKDSECSKDSKDNWSKKKRKVNAQQSQRFYKTVGPSHGGRNNCTRKLYDTRYRDITGSDKCSWSYRSGVNEACYWIGSASYYGAREAGNWTSASSAAGQCKNLTNEKGRPYCQFLHTDSEGGVYSLETRNTCSVQKCHRPGSGKCNTHGGWGGWKA